MPGTPATAALTAAGLAFTEHTYEHDPANRNFGLEAAEALGIEPEQVFKTLLADVDGVGLVVAIVPVTGHLDLGARPTVLDETAELFDTVYVSGGRRGFDLGLAPAVLIEATGAVIAAIAKD
jgi:Cys-tRNA(Pro)/Cys-tRNA(Cys) deacylase